jgi:ATP-dependent DNA helicase RecG
MPDVPISFVHGRLKADVKENEMASFAAGHTRVLVSTTVIEVGVNVPNATLMIVENAERFGLSQLHQLRGRVGRGSKKSYCILVSGTRSKNQLSEKSRSRLETMCRSYDGFSIAEEDLKQRGPGDFLRLSSSNEIRQSGDMYFKLADMCEDASVMTEAFTAARDFVANEDPELYRPMLAEIQRMFTIQSDIIS